MSHNFITTVPPLDDIFSSTTSGPPRCDDVRRVLGTILRASLVCRQLAGSHADAEFNYYPILINPKLFRLLQRDRKWEILANAGGIQRGGAK